jgi:hypothetical protein
MTNELNTATDNRILAPSAPPQSLGERLRELTDADLKMMQGHGASTESASPFDNAFKNGFKNIAEW